MITTKVSLLYDVEDLYEELLAPLGISKSQYKKHGLKKGLLFKARAEVTLPIDLLMLGEVNPVYEGPEVNILQETDEFLTVSKPFGVHGLSQSYSEKNTIHNFLRERGILPDCGEADHGLLYRLDLETSGVLIFAKNEEAYQEIREGFNELAKEKIYIAIVEGKVEDLGTLFHKLKPYGEKGLKQIESNDGKEGILSILKTQYNEIENKTLVQISLETGLRHQIRAQLSILGHPIVGDELYGAKPAKRLYLHALKYAFDWEGKRLVFYDDNALLFDEFFDLNSCL